MSSESFSVAPGHCHWIGLSGLSWGASGTGRQGGGFTFQQRDIPHQDGLDGLAGERWRCQKPGKQEKRSQLLERPVRACSYGLAKPSRPGLPLGSQGR